MFQEHSSILEQIYVEHITQIIMTEESNKPESSKKSLAQGLFSFLSSNQNEEEAKQPQICEEPKRKKLVRDKYVQRTIELGYMNQDCQWTMVVNTKGNLRKKATRMQRALWIKKYCEQKHEKYYWMWAEEYLGEKNIKQDVSELRKINYLEIPECQDILLIFNDSKWRAYKAGIE